MGQFMSHPRQDRAARQLPGKGTSSAAGQTGSNTQVITLQIGDAG